MNHFEFKIWTDLALLVAVVWLGILAWIPTIWSSIEGDRQGGGPGGRGHKKKDLLAGPSWEHEAKGFPRPRRFLIHQGKNPRRENPGAKK